MNKYDIIFYALIYIFIILLSLGLIGEEKNSQEVNITSSIPIKILKGDAHATR